MNFTPRQAYEASRTGNPIMVSGGEAIELIRQHRVKPGAGLDFVIDMYLTHGLSAPATHDAAVIMFWLGLDL